MCPTFMMSFGYSMTSKDSYESLTWNGTPHAACQAHHVAVSVNDGADAVQSAVNASPPVPTKGCHLHRHRAGRLPRATTAPRCRPHLVISCNWQPSSKLPGRLCAAAHKEAVIPGSVASPLLARCSSAAFTWAGTACGPSETQQAKTVEHVHSQDAIRERTQSGCLCRLPSCQPASCKGKHVGTSALPEQAQPPAPLWSWAPP